MKCVMLAATANKDRDISNFPLLVTPKIDGVRALIVKGQLVSRSGLPIPNNRIRSTLERLLPEGADGELYCGDFYTTTSTVMSFDANGDFKFFWFDWAYDVSVPYYNRVSTMETYIEVNKTNKSVIVPLIPHAVHDMEQLYDYEKHVLDQGFEGLILRMPSGRYKFGRSTLKEGLMTKFKRFGDSEAVIVGTEELMNKNNQAGNTLGAIVAKKYDGTTFKVGTGFTADQRLALWINRETIVGKIVKYKHDGGKNKPRCPVFLGIRHSNDT